MGLTLPLGSTAVNPWQTGTVTVTTARRSTARSEPLPSAGCCSPVTGGVLSHADAERLAQSLKAVADPARLRLLSLIAAHDDAEACVCELTEPLGLSQGTVSHHLKVLVDAGILSRDQRGKWAFYRIQDHSLDALGDALRGAR